MKACIINYYFFKDVFKDINDSIRMEFDYDESLIFNFTNFLTVPYFSYAYSPFKKDKYQLYEKFQNNFDDFFIDLVISLNEKNDYKRLLFLYCILATKTFHEYLDPYILKYKEPKETLDDVFNMLDYYYAYQNGIDLTKESLYQVYNNAYTYYDYVDDLIHYPLIKNYHFLASKEYFIRSYKNFLVYAKYDSAKKIKRIDYFIYDLFFKKKKKKLLLVPYKNKLNTSILDRRSKDDNINNIFKKAKSETINRINAINDYLFTKNTKLFKKKFNINEDKKI